MNWRRGAAKTVASDEPTVHWREPSVYLVIEFEQDKDAPRRSLKHRMNRWVCSGSSDGALEQLCERSCAVEATSSSTGWTDARKKIALDHPTVLLLATFSQRLVWCLGLFIPPPLTHLRLLDCVEVQRSARHLEDHIQSIQVLNFSSIDLHMLSVCA
jgi:hypothetical protein